MRLRFGSFTVVKFNECDYMVVGGTHRVVARMIDYKHAVNAAYKADQIDEQLVAEVRKLQNR
jgi:hypothetical protein